jgi:UDP-N-acetyl-D-glucosamine dehydrogenase
MVKLLENTFRAVNIGLANELSLMCYRLGIDTREVIDAAATKPFGFMPFYPGPGCGGHCIKPDPLYLSWKLSAVNYRARFIGLADEINAKMPHHVVNITTRALNSFSQAVRGSTITVFGVTYKADVADTRESPAIEIIHELQQLGARVGYVDEYVPVLKLPDGSQLEGQTRLLSCDCAMILAAHRSTPQPKQLLEKARVVVDTRGHFSSVGRPKNVFVL